MSYNLAAVFAARAGAHSPSMPSLPEATNDDAPRSLPPASRGRGLTHEIVRALTAQLDAGEIRPGDRLPTENLIMARFGVSRGVVREALSRLQASGRVQTHHGVGTFALAPPPAQRLQVSEPADGIADMLDMLELRAGLETDAAGLAAMRRSEPQLQAMREALAAFERGLDVVGASVAPDVRFHQAIAEATGNRYFADMLAQLGSAVIPRTRVSATWLDAGERARYLQKVNSEHQDILAAIERRDADGARAAMRVHLVNSRERQRLAHTSK